MPDRTRLPPMIATSVVRGADQGESHGGVFLIDLTHGTYRQVVDWNSVDIDFAGRGWDRGLRGIAILGADIYIAASDELFVFDRDFQITQSYRNPYLKHCHEIAHYQGRIYLTSTGFDSVLAFDVETARFVWALHLSLRNGRMVPRLFDPEKPDGPAFANRFHVNAVHCDESGVYFSGLKTGALIRVTDTGIALAGRLPLGVHNARPYNGGLLYNDTRRDQLCWVKDGQKQLSAVPRYAASEILHVRPGISKIARQAFARGLCSLGGSLVAGGSSPSTVAVHDLSTGETLAALNLSMDVRNAIHGLELWPFSIEPGGPASA